MKKFRCSVPVVILCLFAGSLFAKTTLKMAVIVPKQSIWGEKLEAAAKKIKEETNGDVKLRIYYGGVQGDELKVVQKMRIGQLQGAGFMARGMSKICPDSLIFSIPLQLYSDDEAITLHKKMESYFEKQAKDRGYHVVGWTNQGFTYCYSKNKIVNLEDLRNSRPWMLENDEFSKSFFKCSGISAVPAQVSDVTTALQSGMIRTVFTPPIGMIIMQWHTRVSNKLDIGLFYSFGAIIFTEKAWKKIPEKSQKIITDILLKAIEELNIAIKKQNDDASAVLSKTIVSTPPTPDGLKSLRAVTAKVEADMSGKSFSKESMELLKKYLKEYRSKKVNK
jgi:TRAP-type C4-dicarboxylate transport system substrate-binding protein